MRTVCQHSPCAAALCLGALALRLCGPYVIGDGCSSAQGALRSQSCALVQVKLCQKSGVVIRGAGCAVSSRWGSSVTVLVIVAIHHDFRNARGEICSNSWLSSNKSTWVEISCICDVYSTRKVHTTPGTFRLPWRTPSGEVQQNRCGCWIRV
jgi:hypothetical protein